MVAVNDGSQSEPTDGPRSVLRQRSVVEVVVAIVAECSCSCCSGRCSTV